MKQIKGIWWNGGTTMPLYDFFVKIHMEIANSYGWHGTSFFLPAHKYFLWMFETAMIYTAYTKRTTLGITDKQACSITLPYWDWLLDADLDWNDDSWPCYYSPVLDSRVMGSWETDQNSLYVIDGYFANLKDWTTYQKTSASDDPSDPSGPYYDNHLKRYFVYDYQMTTDNPTCINGMVDNFETFTGFLEGRLHGTPHMFIYESMSLMFSPDDPLFWLHHCNIDRLYHFWADCWEYDAIKSLTSTNTKQYKPLNPVSGRSTDTAYFPYYPYNKYDVGLTAKIPFWVGENLDSYIFPKADFPTPQKLWSMGDSGALGYDSIWYRYGPDTLCQQFGTSCTKNLKWRWVNQPTSTTKRSLDDEEMDENSHPRLAHVKEQGKYFREEVAKGRDHQEVLFELATANCHTVKKLDENDPVLLSWIKMNRNSIESWDSPCDKISERITKESEDNAQTNELSAGGNFVPIWVIVSASIGTAIILITIVVVIIIFLRKRSQNVPQPEYSYAEMTE